MATTRILMAHTKKSIYADLPQEFVLVAIYKLLANFMIGKVWPFTCYLKLRHILLQFLNPLPKRQMTYKIWILLKVILEKCTSDQFFPHFFPRSNQYFSLESIFDCLQTVDMGTYY